LSATTNTTNATGAVAETTANTTTSTTSNVVVNPNAASLNATVGSYVSTYVTTEEDIIAWSKCKGGGGSVEPGALNTEEEADASNHTITEVVDQCFAFTGTVFAPCGTGESCGSCYAKDTCTQQVGCEWSMEECYHPVCGDYDGQIPSLMTHKCSLCDEAGCANTTACGWTVTPPSSKDKDTPL
jgi:hypothetical protein